jgi:hypothetical protein
VVAIEVELSEVAGVVDVALPVKAGAATGAIPAVASVTLSIVVVEAHRAINAGVIVPAVLTLPPALEVRTPPEKVRPEKVTGDQTSVADR